MISNKTILTPQEQLWLSSQRITRLTDNKEALIYPMGAERFLSSRLFKQGPDPYHYDIKSAVINKNLLVIPGYGNSAFLFALAGAHSVIVYDKDPLTIAWMKAFKKYYHYSGDKKNCASIGEILTALTAWYPPSLTLSSGKHFILRLINPKALRRIYIGQLLSLVAQAIKLPLADEFELNKDIRFYCGEIKDLVKEQPSSSFDTAFIPYLLGVENGIETKEEIVSFIMQLRQLLIPTGRLIVTPANSHKEFRFTGKRYFATTGYNSIQSIPELQPYLLTADPHWFDTQGLAVFSSSHSAVSA